MGENKLTKITMPFNDFDSIFTQLINDRLYRSEDAFPYTSIVRYEPQHPAEIGIEDSEYAWHECPYCTYRLPDNQNAICDYCNSQIPQDRVIHHFKDYWPPLGNVLWLGCPSCDHSLGTIDRYISTLIRCDYCGDRCTSDGAIVFRSREVDEF